MDSVTKATHCKPTYAINLKPDHTILDAEDLSNLKTIGTGLCTGKQTIFIGIDYIESNYQENLC